MVHLWFLEGGGRPRKPTLAFTTLARPIMVVDYEFPCSWFWVRSTTSSSIDRDRLTFQTMGLAENCLGLPYDTWDGRKRTLAREFFWPAVQLVSHTNRINALRKQHPHAESSSLGEASTGSTAAAAALSASASISAKGCPVASRTAPKPHTACSRRIVTSQ
jgi:hypothetical protein